MVACSLNEYGYHGSIGLWGERRGHPALLIMENNMILRKLDQMLCHHKLRIVDMMKTNFKTTGSESKMYAVCQCKHCFKIVYIEDCRG